MPSVACLVGSFRWAYAVDRKTHTRKVTTGGYEARADCCNSFERLFTCSSNSANAPWGWDDRNDAPARGALALDPAGLVKNYFNIPEPVSTTYTYNPYR